MKNFLKISKKFFENFWKFSKKIFEKFFFLGHFCVYAAQRIFSNNWSTNRNGNNNGQQNSLNSPKMHEKRGCINVTTPTFVQLGCTHKWVQNELEEIYCACKVWKKEGEMFFKKLLFFRGILAISTWQQLVNLRQQSPYFLFI